MRIARGARQAPRDGQPCRLETCFFDQHSQNDFPQLLFFGRRDDDHVRQSAQAGAENDAGAGLKRPLAPNDRHGLRDFLNASNHGRIAFDQCRSIAQFRQLC
jgi:hypothetical protein